MPKGYLAFVMHAHLPYVRHPEYENFLEERWFFEAMTEVYIPLVRVLNRLVSDRVFFKLTLSMSPTLLSMMEDPLLQERYASHLVKLIELSEREMQRTSNEPHFRRLAEMYHGLFSDALDLFAGQYDGRLSSAFGHFHEWGAVELITTAATHAILPLLASQPKAVSSQIATGLDYFEDVFGFRPQGLWLPECGYCPALEEILFREKIRFFFVESHGIEHAETSPFYGVHAPVFTPAGVAAFGRDQTATQQVWSAREGFPGDPAYREFYRDIGHDLDFDYIRPYICGDVRVDTGLKYYRVTGPTSWKEPYDPPWAKERAAHHAGEFLQRRITHVEYLETLMETAPIVVAPFDAELFGHWWFEGPQWLDFVIRKAAFDQNTLELTTLSGYLDRHPVHQMSVPATSTWGDKGYFEVWVNGRNDWIYPQLYECTHVLEVLAARYGRARRGRRGRVSRLVGRALRQCLRELLLAQSSDWPFMINNGTSAEYAVRRVKDHVSRFRYLAASIEKRAVNEAYLTALEQMDNIFPKADFRLFC